MDTCNLLQFQAMSQISTQLCVIGMQGGEQKTCKSQGISERPSANLFDLHCFHIYIIGRGASDILLYISVVI
jgi:hypothetical protein